MEFNNEWSLIMIGVLIIDNLNEIGNCRLTAKKNQNKALTSLNLKTKPDIN